MKIVRSLTKITKKTVKALEAHPVAKTMFKGTMTKKAYIHYLIQTVKYVAYSPPFLQAAACGAMAKYPDLAAIFQVKSAEETDHDNLALEDLEKLGIDKPSVIETPACAAVDEYIQYHVREIAEGVPAAFFGACWVLETLAIACGPKALKGLRNNPNRQIRNAVRFVEVHAADDIEHVKKLTKVLNTITDPDQQRAILASATKTADCFVRYFDMP